MELELLIFKQHQSLRVRLVDNFNGKIKNKMKPLTLIIALLYGSLVLLIFPLFFIHLNSFFSLPVYSSFHHSL